MNDIERIDWWVKEKPKIACIEERLLQLEHENLKCWLRLQYNNIKDGKTNTTI